MTKQFAGNINQVSNQVNAVVMGMAGAERVFNLMDQQPETDDGYVTLVNAREENGPDCGKPGAHRHVGMEASAPRGRNRYLYEADRRRTPV